MVISINDSKRFHHGRVRQEHRLAGIIELWIDDKKIRHRTFRCPKERKEFIENWYRISPALKNNYHYFIIKYDYDLV